MQAYISMISIYAFPFAIRDWAICQGQTITINSNQALFSLIGTSFGGNGNTDFMLPQFGDRAAVSKDDRRPLPVGGAGGQTQTTLTVANLPPHTHAAASFSPALTVDVAPPVSDGAPDSTTPGGNYLPEFDTVNAFTATPQAVGQMASDPRPVTATFDIQVGQTGSGQPFTSRSPYLVLNYQICVQGIYPSRN